MATNQFGAADEQCRHSSEPEATTAVVRDQADPDDMRAPPLAAAEPVAALDAGLLRQLLQLAANSLVRPLLKLLARLLGLAIARASELECEQRATSALVVRRQSNDR